jgi:hypothetical protein
MEGEVRRTVNRVHGAWGGGSLRKGSATAFPCDSGEASGSPVVGFGQEAMGGHGGCRVASWWRRKAEGGERR